jgi:hypothetical protein
LADLPSAWQAGGCIGGRGNACFLRHYYLDRSARHQRVTSVFCRDAVAVAAARPRLAVPEAIAAFSSPYTLKVRKQVARHHRVEVDVDTGSRRSWVEEEELEVMDLTGETPAKAVRRRLCSPPPPLPCTPLKPGGRSVQPQVGGRVLAS